MKAIEKTTITIPYSPEAVEYAERYCSFYLNAKFSVTETEVIIIHKVEVDPTDSVFWPGN